MAKSIFNLIAYRFHDIPLKEAASIHFRGKLIDIGCGNKPYVLSEPLIKYQFQIPVLIQEFAPLYWNTSKSQNLHYGNAFG
jgi:hypothetical protein